MVANSKEVCGAKRAVEAVCMCQTLQHDRRIGHGACERLANKHHITYKSKHVRNGRDNEQT